MKFELSGHVLRKEKKKKRNNHIIFHENPSSRSPAVPCERKDRQNEANSPFFSILRTRLKKESRKRFITSPEVIRQFVQKCHIAVVPALYFIQTSRAPVYTNQR